MIQGKPCPTAKWYKDGTEIESNTSNYIIEFNANSGLASLIIKKISKENEGRFTCVSRNLLGSCSTSAIVNIKG